MTILPRLAVAIDTFTEFFGRLCAYLGLCLVLLMSALVILRYGFNISTVAMQELLIYFHAVVFMLGAAFTLKKDKHVRVDIFYRRFSPVQQAWVNAIGAMVFLLPICLLVFVTSWDFVLQSWRILEGSPEPGGLPGVFLLKTLIPLFAVLMALQAVAEIIRNGLILASSAVNEVQA